jgi:acyl-CoA synthetase (AMP-forming)/AMP-acid ligase II/thioesterase domain-containing protein/acyl carrier protein
MQIEDSSTVWQALSSRARENPLAPAILAPGRKDLTYPALLAQIREAVQAVNAFGFGRGDRIAIALPQGPECPAALVSIMSGCICVPLNPAYSVAEFSSSLSNSRAAALMTRSGEVPNAALAAQHCHIPVIELELLPGEEAGRFLLHCEPHSSSRRAPSRPTGFPAADDIAVIFATSGTTSSPKLIPLTQAMVCERARRARHSVDLTSSDRCLDLIPSFQGGAIRVSILGTLFAGASSVYPGVTAPADFERCLIELKPTWCALPPPFLEMLLRTRPSGKPQPEQGGHYTGLRAFLTTGAPVPAETVEAIERQFGILLQNYYGAAECGGMAVNPLPPRLRKHGSVGLGIGPELVILDDDGQPAEPGRPGEIAVRGPGVFSGYENPNGSGRVGPGEKTSTPETPPFLRNWYRTGDRGYLDTDGYLFLTGRLGNVINRGGEKISSEEIEEVLRRHPTIRDAVAFPIPHEVLGAELGALVVTVPGATTNITELRHFVAEHVAAFKVPRTIIVVDTIPVGAAGKVQRNQLASQFAETLASAMQDCGRVHVPPGTTLERVLSDIWERVLKVDRIGTRDRFLDIGGNSLLAVNMLAEVERRFGRKIPLGPFWQSPTVENLAALVVRADFKKCSVLFPVQTSGCKPPLFCVLPGWYVREAEILSNRLGPDQPVYALIPDPRPGAGQSGLTREEIVAECVAAIESTQAEGPYFVIGRSVGGLVALEIAQRLRGDGKKVALVGLIDTHYPGLAGRGMLSAPLRRIEMLMGRVATLPRSRWAGVLRRLPLRACRYAGRKLTGRRLPSQIATTTLYTCLQRLFHDEPPRWPGRIVFFAAELSKHRGFLDRRWYWGKAAEQGLEVHLIPGNHDKMVQEPHVLHFAAALKGCLERAGREAP